MSLSFLYSQELKIISFLQKALSLLDNFFRIFPFFHSEAFLLLLLATIWAFYGKKWGLRLTFLILIDAFLNLILKKVLAQPRPFMLEPSLGLIQVGGNGIPSGDAQTSFLFTCLLISLWKSRWAWFVGINYVFWTALSRVYLGIHFPTDILGGWIVGASLFVLWRFFLEKIERAAQKKPYLWLVSSQGVFLLLSFFSFSFYGLTLAASSLGLSSGLWLGLRNKVELARVCFREEGILRLGLMTIGFLILFSAFFGILFFFPSFKEGVSFGLLFLLGLWISFFFPLFCNKWISK